MDEENHAGTLGKGALLSIALGELACGRPSGPEVAQNAPTVVTSSAPAPATSEAPPADTTALAARLARYAVVGRTRARKTLYTWTTRAQVEALAKDPLLLTRAESPDFGASYFDQVLHTRANAKDPLAKLLRTSAFARARFAWPAPFATSRGLGAETYGDELIRIDLKPEAWIVVLATSKPEMEVIDLEGRPVATADVLAHPSRIAVVYFVHDNPVTGYAASMAGPEERLGYREYVVCNESMIASYSVRTAEIGGELADEAKLLEDLAAHLRAHPEPTDRLFSRWNARVATETFRAAENPKSLVALFEATLSFPVEAYRPDPGALHALADRLLKLEMEAPPMTHAPTVVFPSPSAVMPSPPPRVVKRTPW